MSERFAAVERCLNRLRHHPVLLHSACGDEGMRDLSCAWSELDAANQELRSVAPAFFCSDCKHWVPGIQCIIGQNYRECEGAHTTSHVA